MVFSFKVTKNHTEKVSIFGMDEIRSHTDNILGQDEYREVYEGILTY